MLAGRECGRAGTGPPHGHRLVSDGERIKIPDQAWATSSDKIGGVRVGSASQPSKAMLPSLTMPSVAMATSPARRGASWLGIDLSVVTDLEAIGPEWQRFEQSAEGTVFQSYDWLSVWHRHIGCRHGVRPAIVIGRNSAETIVLLLPLAVTPGIIRRLGFLGDGLCDYNMPLIAPELLSRLREADFLTLWRKIRGLVRRHPLLGHDVIELSKMPEAIGAFANPFLHLDVQPNPSGAHLTRLAGTWDAFYTAKRSSATRRRDRTKLKRLAEHGEIRFVNPSDGDDLKRTIETLMDQKASAFARMGVNNLFALPGHRAFFLDLGTNPRTRHLVHVSRLDVGATCAAANLGYLFRDTYYHILASYDNGEIARFGPGAAHLRGLLQYAIENGFKCFDFTIGDERYKLEWSDTSVKLHDHVAAATLRGWPVVFLARAFRRLKRLIKQTPLLWRLFNALRAAAGALRRPGGGSRGLPDRSALCNKSPSIAPRDAGDEEGDPPGREKAPRRVTASSKRDVG